MSAAIMAMAASGSAATSPHAGVASPVLPYRLESMTLDNGLRVVLVPFPSPGIVAYYTLVRTGAREEVEKGHSGFAHLFEHMMFRGSKNYPRDAGDRLMQGLGYDDNAWTSEDETVYTLYGPSRGLADVMAREADRFIHLEYSKETLQTESKAVLGEYNKSASDPVFKMEEAFLAAAYKKHPYGHTVIGYLADIQAMTEKYDYSLGFFRRFYRPDNCIIFVVGDFDAARVLADVKRLYGGWSGKASRAKIISEPPQKRGNDVTVDWPTSTQTRLMIGWRTPSGYEGSAVQEVLKPYLFGPTSKLHKDLVLDRQIVESLDGWYAPHRDPRAFHFVVTMKDDAKVAEVRAAVEAAVAGLCSGRIDQGLLASVKSNYRYRALSSIETPSDLAGALASGASATGDVDGLERLLEAVGRVTSDDLQAFAHKHFAATNRTVVTLRPKR